VNDFQSYLYRRQAYREFSCALHARWRFEGSHEFSTRGPQQSNNAGSNGMIQAIGLSCDLFTAKVGTRPSQ
jgi:hypothetical protein